MWEDPRKARQWQIETERRYHTQEKVCGHQKPEEAQNNPSSAALKGVWLLTPRSLTSSLLTRHSFCANHWVRSLSYSALFIIGLLAGQ